MATNGTLLCIHRDPVQLSLLQENGYELAIATNGSDGLRLFRSQTVDTVVLEYHLGLLDGATIADEINQVRPEVPIVMLADHSELPAHAFKFVDAFVDKV
jgi:DNA-binding response OmpR family regulator